MLWIFLLIAAFGYCSYQQQQIAEATRRIQTENAAITASETKIAPLTRKIAILAGWKQVVSQHKRIAEILSKIETAMSPDICIRSILIKNSAKQQKALDSMKVTIGGWTRSSIALDKFADGLPALMPAYSVAKVDPATLDSDAHDPKSAEKTEEISRLSPFAIVLTPH